MAEIQKVIYLPKEWGDGPYNKWGYPRIIYCFVVRDDAVIGSAWEDEAIANRGKVYPVKRCLPYTEENWYLCNRHIEKRDELKKEYNQLIALANKTHLTMCGSDRASRPEGTQPLAIDQSGLPGFFANPPGSTR